MTKNLPIRRNLKSSFKSYTDEQTSRTYIGTAGNSSVLTRTRQINVRKTCGRPRDFLQSQSSTTSDTIRIYSDTMGTHKYSTGERISLRFDRKTPSLTGVFSARLTASGIQRVEHGKDRKP